MDVTVNPEELAKTLTEVRTLLKDCLIPRLDRLEYEVGELRRFTWPVCAPFYEQRSQLDNISIKSKVLLGISEEELKNLLKIKKLISEKIHFGSDYLFGRERDEYHEILSYLLSHQ